MQRKIFPGPTLLEYRKTQAGQRIEIAQAVKFAVEIAAGVDCAHRRGIVHRDIKSENIIVADNTEARIADFGLARRFDTVAAASPEEFRKAMSGTYEYMAPEQWHCEKPDMYTDIYSLGATVYEMVSGRRPFEEAPDLAVMKLVLNDAKNDLPELRFAVLDITDNIADEKCAELGAPLRMKVAGGVKRLNGKLTGKRIGVDEITAEQLRPFKNLSRKTFTIKDLPDQEVTNFMERGGILIRGFWQKNADEIVLQFDPKRNVGEITDTEERHAAGRKVAVFVIAIGTMPLRKEQHEQEAGK